MEIKGFLETSFVDWPGNICAVVFTPGCNFRCPFCHNYELVLAPQGFESFPVDYVLERLATFQGWIDGVCVTGGEPTLQPGIRSFMRAIRDLGFQVKLDTNGTRPDLLADMTNEGLLDYVAMDIKGPLNHIDYSHAAGVPVDLEAIEQSITILRQGRIPYEFRTTIVPTLHGEREIAAMADDLEGCLVWRLQEFNPANPMDESFRSIRPYDSDTIATFAQIARTKVNAIH